MGKTYIDGWEIRLPDAVTKEAAVEDAVVFGTRVEVATGCSSSNALPVEELTTRL